MFYQMDQIESLKELPTHYNNLVISKLAKKLEIEMQDVSTFEN